VSVLLPIALVLAAGGVVYAGARLVQPFFGRRVCPTCGQRRVEPDPDMQRAIADDDVTRHASAYRCRNCTAEWRAEGGGPLMTPEAFATATRAPLPTAIVHPPEPR
jgi:hypothetical protein